MTIRDLFALLLLGGCAPLLILALTSCSQPTESAHEPAPVAQTVGLVPKPAAPDEDAPKPRPVVAAQPQSEPQPPAFAFAPDLTGKALPRVVVPDVERTMRGEHARTVPKPRAVPDRVLDPDAMPRASDVPPTVTLPKPSARKPSNPAEKVPVNFGRGPEDVPEKPVLPVKPGVTERARDVNVPPPAPALGRQASDRVSLDDPTGELGNAEVTATSANAPLAPSGFLKVVVPDPFELAEQVKPKVPPSLEPSAAPIPVDPRRVK